MTISFVVYGVAQPAGSKRGIPLKRKDGRPITRENGSIVTHVIDANPKASSWKHDVASAARQAYTGPLLAGPLHVELRFYRPRPKGHFRDNGQLNALGRKTPYPITKPDKSKLTRGVEDALTRVIWHDDAQIVTGVESKLWGEPARVEVHITQAALPMVAREIVAEQLALG